MPPRLRSAGWSWLSEPANSHILLKPSHRQFSATAQRDTRLRRTMWQWLRNQGANLREPLPKSTNYLGAYDSAGRLKRSADKDSDRDDSNAVIEGGNLPRASRADLKPFPLNQHFRSEEVLSEAYRETIWTKVMKDGLSVRTVSVQLGVEMSRVAAVVRLKEIEKKWMQSKKPLALPYAKAVMAMLPQTEFAANGKMNGPHESINDLPAHAATMKQIFYPTSESRHFTREDAAKVFDENLLPADQRVPHPQLAEIEKDKFEGLSKAQLSAKEEERRKTEENARLQAERKRQDWEAANIKKVHDGRRWEFRFQEIKVDDAGRDGRGHRGTGWRYGAPLMDRKRGQVKIPRRVL